MIVLLRQTFVFTVTVLLINVVSCKKPNVLLFILDDLRPALGCYGDKNAFSPNIDKLASEGIIFNNTFAQQALCAPSRNSFLTSRRPDTVGLYDFYSYWRTFSGNFTTLPQHFKENGYKTFSFGKVFHPGISSNYSDDQPYSWSDLPYHPPTEIYKNAKVCYTKGKTLPQKNVVCPVQPDQQPGGTLPDIETKNKVIEHIARMNKSDKPFFMAVGFHKPHIPLKYPALFKKYHPLKKVVLPPFRKKPPDLPNVAWNPWTDLRERDDIQELNISFPFGVIKDKEAKKILQSYYAAVTYVDHLVGEIMTQLEKSKLVQNTIITLIGDHGWSLGEHGEWSKFSNFDVATRVPFILNVPGISNSKWFKNNPRFPIVIQEPVELVDLFPSLVDLTGLKPLKMCSPQKKEKLCTEGKSLYSLLIDVLKHNKDKKRRLWDTVAFSQYPRPGEYPTEKPNSDKPKLKQIKIMGCSLRTNRYRYTEWLSFKNLTILWDETIAAELYDHKFDPSESHNLVNEKSYFKLKHQLSEFLRIHWQLRNV